MSLATAREIRERKKIENSERTRGNGEKRETELMTHQEREGGAFYTGGEGLEEGHKSAYREEERREEGRWEDKKGYGEESGRSEERVTSGSRGGD